MASPQCENGFTKLSNELFERIISAKLNGTQYAIILALIRATYGFHKKSRTLGLAFFRKHTGRNRNKIAENLNELIRRRYIIVKNKEAFGRSRELMLNKNYDEWIPQREVSP